MNDVKIKITNEKPSELIIPKRKISAKVLDWYHDSNDKYMTMECPDRQKALSLYQTVYAMSKRRHKLNIKRHIRGNIVIVERL